MEPIEEFRSALKTFDHISRTDYQLSFKSILEDTDRRHRGHRVRHLTGVAMKQDFSRLVPGQSGEVPHKWKIDPSLLATTSATDNWGLQMLSVYPGRGPGESTKDVALRLHRETFLARAFILSLHGYVCKDGPARKKVKQIMREIGLKELADCATPEGLIKVGAGSLLIYLKGIMPFVPAAGIAIAAIILCCLGLDSVCKTSTEPLPKTPSRRSKPTR
jgi:hypothetical protein